MPSSVGSFCKEPPLPPTPSNTKSQEDGYLNIKVQWIENGKAGTTSELRVHSNDILSIVDGLSGASAEGVQRIVFNGKSLDSSMTFGECGISNGSKLIAIRMASQTTAASSGDALADSRKKQRRQALWAARDVTSASANLSDFSVAADSAAGPVQWRASSKGDAASEEDSAQLESLAKNAKGALFLAAQKGKLDTLKRLCQEDVDLEACTFAGRSSLHLAADNGHSEIVRCLCESGANRNKKCPDGSTPLILAAQKGHLDVVRYLCRITRAREIDEERHDGTTALFAAADNGHIKVVAELREAGAYVDYPKHGSISPVLAASGKGHAEVVRYLIEEGANYQRASKDGTTPLSAACANRRLEVTRILCESLARICEADQAALETSFLNDNERVNESFPNNGMRLFLKAARTGKFQAIDILHKAGATNVSAQLDEASLLRSAAQEGLAEAVSFFCDDVGVSIVPSVGQESGLAPLVAACIGGSAEVVQVLLERRACAEAATRDAATPLFIASQAGHWKVAQLLCEAGATVDRTWWNGSSPLFAASQQGRVETVRTLYQAGANPNLRRNDGSTPLLAASSRGHLDVVSFLCRKDDVDLNACMDDGATPLILAAQNGHSQVVGALCVAGARTQRAMTNGVAPVYVAAQNGHRAVVRMLWSARADLEQATESGATAFLIASQKGHLDVVRFLCESSRSGAIDKARRDGTTPLFAAARHGHLQVVCLLCNGGADKRKARADGCDARTIASEEQHEDIARFLDGFEKQQHVSGLRSVAAKFFSFGGSQRKSCAALGGS
jgi:ankyrin repeat protein